MLGWNNGDIEPVNEMTIPVLDRGVQYGEGLYETMLVRAEQIPLLNRHLNRLHSSCKRIDLPYPGDGKLRRIVTDTIQANRSSENNPLENEQFIIKLLLMGGTGEGLYRSASPNPNLLLLPRPFPNNLSKWKDQGGIGRFVLARGNTGSDLAQVKSTSRLGESLALEHVHREDNEYREALFVDDLRRLLQGARSNIFVREGETWHTPPVSTGVLPGIAREILLEQSNPGSVIETELFTEDLLRTDCIAVTNAVTGPVQLRKIVAPSLLAFDRGPLTFSVRDSITLDDIWTNAISL